MEQKINITNKIRSMTFVQEENIMIYCIVFFLLGHVKIVCWFK
jgi:hypothetical protein